ncbi:MAG: hypothetical protein Q9164_007394 [Protoblastenia rupestris]
MPVLQPVYSSLKAFKGLGNNQNGNGGDAGRVYNGAPKWYVGEHQCDEDPGFKWYRTPGDTIPAGSRQSVEHAYELQLVARFLRTKIGTSDFSCDDMERVFFPCGENKMQKIFDQLPGMQLSAQTGGANGPIKKNINLGFVGLEQALNGVKGYLFGKDILTPSGYFTRLRLTTPQTKINTIQDLIMMFDIINTDADFQRMYDVTNDRIYQAYAGLDDFITTNALQRADGTQLPATWAADYKDWMNGWLVEIAEPAWEWASTTHADLTTSLSADTTLDATAKAAQLKQLADIDSDARFSRANFVCDFGLSWTPGSLVIRAPAPKASCNLNPTKTPTATTPGPNPSNPPTPSAASAASAASQAAVISAVVGIASNIAGQAASISSASAASRASMEAIASNIRNAASQIGNVAASAISVSSAAVAEASAVSAASAASAVTAIPLPKETEYLADDWGTAECASLVRSTCLNGIAQYLDANLYTGLTILVGDSTDPAPEVIGLNGIGCYATYECGSDAAYATGMTGTQIKAVARGLYEKPDVVVCGQVKLDNGCSVGFEACTQCLPWPGSVGGVVPV